MKYLNRLKSEKRLLDELQKLQKAPFYSYYSTEGRHFLENIPTLISFFDQSGDLAIPFGSDSRYHRWAVGQSVKDIIEEVRAWVH